MNQEEQNRYIAVLRRELVPAMGCTEPIAIAYAAALCRKYLKGPPKKIHAACSANIIKNAHSAFVPHTGGKKGMEAAAAAGALAGDPDKKLEVLAGITPEDLRRIDEACQSHICTVSRIEGGALLHVAVTLENESGSACVEIRDSHTNVIKISQNGQTVWEKEDSSAPESETAADDSFLTVDGILDFCETVRLEQEEDLIEQQIRCNMAIAEEGLSGKYGVAIASCFDQSNLYQKMKAFAAAASEARMSGCELPVVINSGSGNQGIAVSVPVIVYARETGVPRERLYRALLLSNLLAIHQKSGIGKLSAFCGAVCATCASGAAICYLQTNGNREAVRRSITNTLANTSGILCDGAKPSCAAKISSGLDGALLGCALSLHQRQYCEQDGIVKNSVEETIDAVGRIAREGMEETDKVVFEFMLEQA